MLILTGFHEKAARETDVRARAAEDMATAGKEAAGTSLETPHKGVHNFRSVGRARWSKLQLFFYPIQFRSTQVIHFTLTSHHKCTRVCVGTQAIEILEGFLAAVLPNRTYTYAYTLQILKEIENRCNIGV